MLKQNSTTTFKGVSFSTRLFLFLSLFFFWISETLKRFVFFVFWSLLLCKRDASVLCRLLLPRHIVERLWRCAISNRRLLDSNALPLLRASLLLDVVVVVVGLVEKTTTTLCCCRRLLCREKTVSKALFCNERTKIDFFKRLELFETASFLIPNLA